MSKDWEVKKLKDVCQIRPPKKESKEELLEDDKVSFVPMGDLGVLTKNFTVKQEKTFKEVYKGYTYFREEDVLLAKITPCFENGKLGIARNLKNGIGFGSSEYIVIRSKEDLIPDYLYYFLSKKNFRLNGQKVMTGAVGHKRVPLKFVENTEIPYPNNLSEQHRIVNIIEEAFNAIDKAKENAKINFQNAIQFFESYLQRIVANPGTDWEEKKLGEVCDLYQGLAINAKTKHLLVEKSDLPLLRIKDLKNGTVEQYIDSNNYPEKSLVNEEDIIYTRTGQIGLVYTGRYGVLHNNSFKVVPKESLLREYLYWFLQNKSFKSQIIRLSSKTAQPDITHKIFKEQTVFVPSEAEQKQIAEKLDLFYAESKNLEDIYRQKLTNLDELKESILQKAFNGEL
ncbi:restriction endonuclease subunit S [Virgibacillus halodenitrificans]|uniref:restriction endonuclease subunit S n=1 Tax=Virgibacillus halodenitrificans TaxID=1482 RepID=UPI00045C77FD|nr:restriction endonuclease subunit S [Virgibacillus halodenitrificans]CDQ31897.1 Type I restriction enzyme EcoKI specificity protein [Virgibacillus halodenitrificans]